MNLDWGIVSLVITTLIGIIMLILKTVSADRNREKSKDDASIDKRFDALESTTAEHTIKIAGLLEFRSNITEDLKEIKTFMSEIMHKLEDLAARKTNVRRK